MYLYIYIFINSYVRYWHNAAMRKVQLAITNIIAKETEKKTVVHFV